MVTGLSISKQTKQERSTKATQYSTKMAPPKGSRRVFGQAMGKSKRGGGGSSYQRQFGGGSKAKIAPGDSKSTEEANAILAAKRRIRQEKAEQIDEKFGYETFAFQNTNGAESREVRERRGWLFNMLPTTVRCPPPLFRAWIFGRRACIPSLFVLVIL